jgi:hypothetical protein
MMKYLKCLFIVILVNFNIFAEEKILTESWIKNQIQQRKSLKDRGNENDLKSLDGAFLDRIDGVDLGIFENLVCEYLCNIITEEKNNIPNIERAFDLLENQFRDKNYFLTVSAGIHEMKICRDPFILKKILDGYVKLLALHHEEIFSSLGLIQKNIEYFMEDKSRFGSDIVLPAYIGFLRRYIILSGSGKIPDKNRDYVINLCEKLNLNSPQSTNVEGYIGSEELREEFYFYNEKSFGK